MATPEKQKINKTDMKIRRVEERQKEKRDNQKRKEEEEKQAIARKGDKNSKTEFWVLGLPGNPSRRGVWERLINSLSKKTYECIEKKEIPSFKICRFNALMELSDHIGKLEYKLAELLNKIESTLKAVIQDRYSAEEAMMIGDLYPSDYVKFFSWDSGRYPEILTLLGLVAKMRDDIYLLDFQLHYFTANHLQTQAALHNTVKKDANSEVDVYNMLRNENVLMESECFTTILIVVPTPMTLLWERTYEHISPKIVPGSSKKLIEEPDNTIYTMIITKIDEPQFRSYLFKETKLKVRDLATDIKMLGTTIEKRLKLKLDERNAFHSLVKWLMVSYKRGFSCMVHLKFVKVYVDSIIKYGLPFRFLIVLLQPKRKSMNKLNKKLNNMFRYLDFTSDVKTRKAIEESGKGYRPYAFTKLEVPKLK